MRPLGIFLFSFLVCSIAGYMLKMFKAEHTEVRDLADAMIYVLIALYIYGQVWP